MKVIVFGATGMVGQGALREALAADDVTEVLTVVRSATGKQHPKLRELVVADMHDFAPHQAALTGYDACFFCLGISSAGMDEAAYTRITHDITAAAASTLAKVNPGMTFIFVSGQGTDSTEQGKTMWARVKGKAENAVFALPFKASYAFRPGFIEPLDGIRSRTKAYNAIYAVFRPLVPVLRWSLGDKMLTTREIGQAMLAAVRRGAPKKILEARDIKALSKETA